MHFRIEITDIVISFVKIMTLILSDFIKTCIQVQTNHVFVVVYKNLH